MIIATIRQARSSMTMFLISFLVILLPLCGCGTALSGNRSHGGNLEKTSTPPDQVKAKPVAPKK